MARSRKLSPVLKHLGLAALAVTIAMIGAGLSTGSPAPANPGVKSTLPEALAGGVSAQEEAASMAALHDWLMKEVPAGTLNRPLLVSLTDQERAELKKKQAETTDRGVVGRTKAIQQNVHFSGIDATLLSSGPRQVAGGVLAPTADGGFVWAMAVEAVGAGAVRLHVKGLDLPSDVDLFVFNAKDQAFGPYQGKGPNGSGEFWSDTVFGSHEVVLLRHYGPDGAAALKGISFGLSDVGHIGTKFVQDLGIAPESFCSFNVSCIGNASCTTGTAADPAKSAVALMQWINGQFIYTCTGGLLNDTVAATQIPYFLTANHCISASVDASNLQAYFQFTLPCGQTNCPPQTQPGGIQRLGSTIKTTGTVGDFTLLQLNQAPPAGSVFLGWNNSPVANLNNHPLVRISHPAWAPQAYSADHVDTSAPTCQGWPRGQRIYERTDVNGTEGGSSGSPVMTASNTAPFTAGQVVGQLSGACGTNVSNDCDHVNNATVDGAFATYWASVQPFLNPVTCTPTTEVCNDGVDNDCDGQIDCADSNCNGSPSCPTCSPIGASCNVDSNCCSNKCKGPAGRKTCR
jgi:hypothetical protein